MSTATSTPLAANALSRILRSSGLPISRSRKDTSAGPTYRTPGFTIRGSDDGAALVTLVRQGDNGPYIKTEQAWRIWRAFDQVVASRGLVAMRRADGKVMVSCRPKEKR